MARKHHMRMRCHWLAVGWVIAGATAACGGDEPLPADAGYNCAIEDRDDEFLAGISKTGAGGLTFRIVNATPAPPARNDNAWQLEITSGGSPVPAGTAVEITPFMPDHRHGTSIRVDITETAAGAFTAEPIYLFMPGLWEITVEATPPAGVADDVIFRFCIPG